MIFWRLKSSLTNSFACSFRKIGKCVYARSCNMRNVFVEQDLIQRENQVQIEIQVRKGSTLQSLLFPLSEGLM